MNDDLFQRIFFNQWIVFATATIILLILAEVGFRRGLAIRRRKPEAAEGQIGSLQGAVLGLLGLLLGFSFAMAVERYDTRRMLVVEEANAIGTTWLRADFLQGERKIAVKNLLKRYTEIRLVKPEEELSEAGLAELVAESTRIQNELWAHATALARDTPTPITASFIVTLNETIDLQSTRLAVRRSHVPGAVWLLVGIVACCGACASGYGSGTVGHRLGFSQLVFPLLIGVVMTLISDIDHPRRGLVRVSLQPLIELHESMKQP